MDFEARVPVPFSIFPSTYRDSEAQTATETKVEVDIKLPEKEKPGREGQHSSSFSVTSEQPPRPEHRYSEEEVRITREEERHHHRPGTTFEHEHHVYESRRPAAPRTEYTDTHIHVDARPHPEPYSSPIDLAERQYRERYRPSHKFETYDATVDGVAPGRYQSHHHTQVNEYTVDSRVPGSAPRKDTSHFNEFTVEERVPSAPYKNNTTHVNEFTVEERVSSAPYKNNSTHFNEFTVDARVPGSAPRKDVKFSEETVEPARFSSPQQKSKMGYYDEDGHYHSFRQGVHKLADRIAHPRHEHAESHHGPRPRPGDSSESYAPNTVTIPCNHIRLGDFLILQGRPCQVIRISTSSATGQYRYLGVDLFTKQLHEESSFISNPAPSVVVQTMLGPVFKQYRVLDIQDGNIVAMTETGDVKQSLNIIDQSNLHGRLARAFESGRGSVRVLVLNDNGQELAVDMKVIHGSRL
ncbi:unnamed protein product [Clonostachys rosea]|uniref:Translation elongation factor IF5A C-terminal domain-containing protein n=1 Tax=Bionectria ochroleuca TaxID=29856 RepID=A0ABY6UQ50_BIOOC|nr:unnamed protein product [Clonostachys rosea]